MVEATGRDICDASRGTRLVCAVRNTDDAGKRCRDTMTASQLKTIVDRQRSSALA
jgi:hypothetical protein